MNPDHVDRQSGALTTRPRCRQKEDKIQKEVLYSTAINESIDNTDSAQVLVFIRAITEDFHCFEELLCLCTLKGRTRGIGIFNAFKEKCNKAKLSFANLVSVCTDGGPAMKGVREGFIGLLNPFDTVGTYMSHGTNVSQLRKVEEIQCGVTKIYLKHIYDINFLELILLFRCRRLSNWALVYYLPSLINCFLILGKTPKLGGLVTVNDK